MCKLEAQEEIDFLRLTIGQETRNGDYWYRRCSKAEAALQEIKKKLTGLLMEWEALDMFEQERMYVRELPEGCIQCDRCGEMVEENEITCLDGTNVCRDCLTDFCNGYVDELGEAYIAEHRKEFCMDWVLPSYLEEDIIRAILADYEKNKQLELDLHGYGAGYLLENEKDFCLQSSDWIDFVKEHAS